MVGAAVAANPGNPDLRTLVADWRSRTPAPPATPVGRARAVLGALWQRAPTAAKAVTGVLTAAATLIGAMAAAGIPPFDPDPPIPMRGELFDAKVTPDVALGEGCLNLGWPCEQFTEEDYAQEGQLVNVGVRLLGYAGQAFEVRWSMHDAATGGVVSPFRDQPGWPRGIVDADANDDQAHADVWAPLPMREGQFFVRLRLVKERDGTELNSLDLRDETFDGMP